MFTYPPIRLGYIRVVCTCFFIFAASFFSQGLVFISCTSIGCVCMKGIFWGDSEWVLGFLCCEGALRAELFLYRAGFCLLGICLFGEGREEAYLVALRCVAALLGWRWGDEIGWGGMGLALVLFTLLLLLEFYLFGGGAADGCSCYCCCY